MPTVGVLAHEDLALGTKVKRSGGLDPHAPATAVQSAVETVIKVHVDQLRQQSQSEDLDKLVRKIRASAQVDYDIYWREFAVAYLLTNYRKALAVLRFLPAFPTSRLLDAGCGPGASALAALTVLAERQVPSTDVVLLDTSQPILSLASELVTDAASAIGIDVDVTAALGNISSYRGQESFGLIVCAHVLCDYSTTEAASMWDELVNQLEPHGLASVVERKSDLRVKAIRGSSTEEELWGHVDVASFEPLDANQARVWHTGWMLHRKPEPWQAELIREYFRAWTSQDKALARMVFHQDATYQEKPFDGPLVGLPEIEDYWETKVLTQHAPCVRIVSVQYGLLSASVTWRAQPDHDRRREVRGIMNFDFEPTTQTIIRLYEVFRSGES